MISRVLTILLLILTLVFLTPWKVLADTSQGQATSPDEEVDVMSLTGGFAKPYAYERQAYGYDPEGVEYKENQSEDFQVIFVTSAPFAAGASFLLTSSISLATRGTFDVNGSYFFPFLGAAFLGTTTIACVSTLTNKYPPPSSSTFTEVQPPSQPLAFKTTLFTARF